ncbi:MAG: hypothetical protein WBF87_01480 [Mesorhizobium sp.]
MDRRDLLLGLAASAVALPAVPALASTPTLKFRDLYSRGTMLTDLAKSLEGRTVDMIGYMAPPLKPEIDFFVLTKLPMSTCPFCESEAQWPDDLVLALTKEPVEVVRYTDLIRVTGRFETGVRKDENTGFVSLVRLVDVSYRKL